MPTTQTNEETFIELLNLYVYGPKAVKEVVKKELLKIVNYPLFHQDLLVRGYFPI